MSTVDFPTWFNSGCYGGLACCMFAIAANALYTTLRQRGTTRQLAGAIVICVISALLLLPALVWYDMRFSTLQATLSFAEIEVALGYVALCGWILPLGVTSTYCLFTAPRSTTTSFHIPRLPLRVPTDATGAIHPPRHQPGTLEPFVFDEDTPWAWLEYSGGNFHGQRLALKRKIATVGRDEDNDIWIDDDVASRHHAELAWDEGKIYITDCNSLNGVLLNGRRIRGYALLRTNDTLEIGEQRFIFIAAQPSQESAGQSDPLANHRWHLSQDAPNTEAAILPATEPLAEGTARAPAAPVEGATPGGAWKPLQDTAEIDHATPWPFDKDRCGALTITDSEMAGQSFLLDRPLMTIGRGSESDIVINDASISRQHAQFLRQADGDYVQDLASRNGTKVNDEPLLKPRLLAPGDVVCLGNICLRYTSVQMAPTSPLTQGLSSRSISGLNSGPLPLRLPSKQKE
jgi:pSer/pThr/pTyr-binding forkhead associated (FHA) protein